MRRIAVIAVLVSVVFASPAAAQQDRDKLAFIIPNIFGDDGFLEVNTGEDAVDHTAHFGELVQANFTDILIRGRLLNIAIATQLTALPLPSSASGIILGTDPDTGLPVPGRQSYGPILTERAETVGKGKFNFSFGYQYFSFDDIDGIDLDSIPDVIPHCDCPPNSPVAFKDDIVTTNLAVDGTVSQFTFLFTYGLHDLVDLSVAVPFVRTDLDVTSVATIVRTGEPDSDIHFFTEDSPDTATFVSSGSATGIGDVIVRLKANPVRQPKARVAVGTDLRLPTGDELDLLGSGAVGVKPFFVFSSLIGERVSPHVNFAYQWNGESTLGDPTLSSEIDLPDQVLYAFGLDVGVNSYLTVVFDILGQQVIDAQRISIVRSVQTPPVRRTILEGFDNLAFSEESYNMTDAAIGAKINPTGSGDLLLDFNVLFKLNDAGLRDSVTPLFGFEYSFR